MKQPDTADARLDATQQAMMIDQTLAALEARPPRYAGDAGRRRLATLEAAIGMCMLDGNLIRTPTFDRLVKLLASGRITERKYENLVRAMCFPDRERHASE